MTEGKGTNKSNGLWERAWKKLRKALGIVPPKAGAMRGRRLASLVELEDRRLLSAAPIGPEFRVNTITSDTQQTTQETPQSVAVAPSGDFITVWSSKNQDTDDFGIYAQRFSAAGAARIGSEFQVNTTSTDQQINPAVAVDASGNFVITWSGKQTGNWDIYAQRFAADGTPLGGEFRVNTTTVDHQQDSSIAMDAAGNFVITWESNNQDGSNWGVFAQRFDSSGAAQGGEIQVNTVVTGEQQDAQVAMDSSGNFVVAWASKDQDGDNWGVFAQRFNATGVKQGSEFQVNTYTNKEQHFPAIAMDQGGNFVIAWSSKDQDGGNYGIYAQRFDNAGNPQGGEFRVNTDTDKDQHNASAAMDANGNFVITWSSKGQDAGDTWGIYSRRYLASGAADGGEFRVNTTINNDQRFSSVGMSPTGNFIILWSGNGPGDGSGVFAQRFATAGIVVTPTAGLVTSEDGASATFTVVLATQPSGNVTISVASSNTAEGTTSVSSLSFTPANWNVAQTVTVTGADDAAGDGNIAYGVNLGPAASPDPTYNNLSVPTVSLVNMDDEVSGITVTPVTGLTTTEAGGAAAFAIVLNTAPTADVTIGLSSSNPAEGTVSVASVTFTSANWNMAQTVTITGSDDAVADGNVDYTIVTATAGSADLAYNGLDAADVLVTNQDNDAAGITVTPTAGLVTTEAGGQASFSVVLDSQPTADVTITLSSSNPAEGTLSTSSLTFTAANWNIAQTVTVTGADDLFADGTSAYAIILDPATSADGGYSGLDPSDVDVTNQDNDVAGINVSTINGPTTEAGGMATFTVVLNSQPTADVTIAIASSDSTEGTVSTSSLTFTAANWNIAQTVTVTGADDLFADGNVNYTIVTAAAASGDANYNGLDPSDVSITNQDNDSAGILVTPTSGLATSESGGSDSFTVALNSMPLLPVTIGISSSNPAEGSVSTGSLTFTALNWNIPQTVTVTGVDDFVADGNVNYSIVVAPASSLDLFYNGLNGPDVAVTNLDDDTAGITVSAISGPTTEAGGTATFAVILNSQPTVDVTIGIASSNPGEGTVSTSSLTFTAANWNIAQTVTVTGVDDFIADGNVNYTIVTAAAVSADANYNNVNPADVAVTNLDDDTAGITVSAISGPTTEAGGTATFAVVLNSQPTVDVTIGIASSNPSEGTVSTSSLTFTAANWNIAQTVTVTGVDDFIADGNVNYTIVTAAAVSADANYNNVNPADVAVANMDNDVAGIIVTPNSDLVLTAGGSASFGIRLTSQPTAAVTIALSSTDPAAATVLPSAVTFTPADWNVTQTITIIGQDIPAGSSDVAFAVTFTPAGSSDGSYAGQVGASVNVILHAAAAQPALPVTDPPTSIIGLLVSSPTLGANPVGSAANSGDAPTDTEARPALDLLGATRISQAFDTTLQSGTSAPLLLQLAATNRTAQAFAPIPRAAWQETGRIHVVALTPAFEEARFEAAPSLLLPTLGASFQDRTVHSDVPLDVLTETGERIPWTDQAQETAALVGTGIIATTGYVLLNTRLGLWMLSLLTSQPLWKQFDPLEVLYAWEENPQQTDNEAEDKETLLTLVDEW